MKDVLFYIAVPFLILCASRFLILRASPFLSRLAARAVIRVLRKRKAKSLQELNAARQKLAVAKIHKINAQIEYEVKKGKFKKKHEKSDLN